MAWQSILAPVASTAVSGLLGSVFGGDDRKRQRQAMQAQQANVSAALNRIGEARGIADSSFNTINKLSTKRLEEAGKGLAGARSELEGQGRFGRQQILEREQGQLSEMRSSMTSRGLGNTTAQDNADRGIRYDTNTALLGFAEDLARLRSDAMFRSTGMYDDVLSGVQSQTMAATGMAMGPRYAEADFRGGINHTATPNNAGSFAAKLGGDIGALVASRDFWEQIGDIFGPQPDDSGGVEI
jgi:hypothetical protein